MMPTRGDPETLLSNREDIASIKLRLAKAEADCKIWSANEDEERYIEAYDRVEALELQLTEHLKRAENLFQREHQSGQNIMLSNVTHLAKSSVTASDGLIGHVRAAFFDDQSWVIRYLVVDTGAWLTGREVLISPYSVVQPLGTEKNINVSLTRKQVEDSPDIDTHEPVSRQHERFYLSYYAYPAYWGGAGLWGMGQYPLAVPSEADIRAAEALRKDELRHADVHLRSSHEVTGYEIHATDGSIGHVDDLLFDAQSWAIRYLVVDTRNWWPGGRKVLIGTQWIDGIDWATGSLHVKLNRAQVRNSPEYREPLHIDRAYEQQLHDAYQRTGYWT